MCNKKVRLITAIIVTSSVLMFNGCGKNNSTTEPVISDAVEETKPTEEVDDTEEIVESEDTEDSSENTVESDNDSLDENSSIGGEDTKTDEEIEAELEEIPTEQADPSTSTDGIYDADGNNLETGEYNADYDTNGGQGWDINGKHYETKGDYRREAYGNPEADGAMTQEELEAYLRGETVEGF